MDALRRSIAEDESAGGAPKKTAGAQAQKGKKRVAGQGELLLPIAGRKGEVKSENKARGPAGSQARGAAGNPAQVRIATISSGQGLVFPV